MSVKKANRTDEWKLIWVVDGKVKETHYENNPRPLAFIRSRIWIMSRTTHRTGMLLPLHKDEGVIKLINELNSQAKLKL